MKKFRFWFPLLFGLGLIGVGILLSIWKIKSSNFPSAIPAITTLLLGAVISFVAAGSVFGEGKPKSLLLEGAYQKISEFKDYPFNTCLLLRRQVCVDGRWLPCSDVEFYHLDSDTLLDTTNKPLKEIPSLFRVKIGSRIKTMDQLKKNAKPERVYYLIVPKK